MHSGFFIENQPQCSQPQCSHLSSTKLFAGRRLPVLAVFGICVWSLLGAAPGTAAQHLSSTIPDDRAAKQEQPQEKPQQGTPTV
jgi:hypothetical protein